MDGGWWSVQTPSDASEAVHSSGPSLDFQILVWVLPLLVLAGIVALVVVGLDRSRGGQ